MYLKASAYVTERRAHVNNNPYNCTAKFGNEGVELSRVHNCLQLSVFDSCCSHRVDMQSLLFRTKQTQLDCHTTVNNCASSAEQKGPGQVAVQTTIHNRSSIWHA